MSLNLNKVILAGRLVADPELKQTQSGISVVSLRIAVNRRYTSRNDGQQSQPEADFFNVTAWRTTAEFIAKFFRKGSAICVVGSIQNSRASNTTLPISLRMKQILWRTAMRPLPLTPAATPMRPRLLSQPPVPAPSLRNSRPTTTCRSDSGTVSLRHGAAQKMSRVCPA